MIISIRFRAPGGLAAHLALTEFNERVEVSYARDVEADIGAAIETLTLIGACGRPQRSLIHIKASPAPGEHLSPAQAQRLREIIEAELRIQTHPGIVVTHVKGNRPAHFHLVYSVADTVTGRAVHDSWIRIRAEKVARTFEAEQGFAPVVGRHNRLVRGALDRERPDIAHLVDADARPISKQATIDIDETQQATRRGADARRVRKIVFEAFEASNRNFRLFAAQLDALGFSIARGDRAIMVLDEATGYSTPLARLLRTEAKAAGCPIALTSEDLEIIFGAAPSLRDALTEAKNKQEMRPTVVAFETAFSALAAADIAAAVAARSASKPTPSSEEHRSRENATWTRHWITRHPISEIVVGMVGGLTLPATIGASVSARFSAWLKQAAAHHQQNLMRLLRKIRWQRRSRFALHDIAVADRPIFAYLAHVVATEDFKNSSRARIKVVEACRRAIGAEMTEWFDAFVTSASIEDRSAILEWRGKGGNRSEILATALRCHGEIIETEKHIYKFPGREL